MTGSPQWPRWASDDPHCVSGPDDDPMNLLIRDASARDVQDDLVMKSGWSQVGRFGRRFSTGYARISGRGCISQDGHAKKGTISNRFHVRLWDCDSNQVNTVIGSAHHEYALTLGVNRPWSIHGHNPTSFEAGKWRVADDLDSDSGYQQRRDAIWLNNMKYVPFANGSAHELTKP